jgi:hypothetical protein
MSQARRMLALETQRALPSMEKIAFSPSVVDNSVVARVVELADGLARR